MVVHLGEPQVLEGEMAQLVERAVHEQFSPPDALQQVPQLGFGH
jgi:hypothetical protein